MRAVCAHAPGGPEALHIEQWPIPEPAAGEVRIRVHASGLNPVDARARSGNLGFMPVRFPFVPGLEHTGVVDAAGAGVDRRWLGRRVLSRRSFGGCADYSIAPAAGLIELDPRIDFVLGAAYRGCSFTAWHLLHLAARVRAGDWVLVHSAAGPVGIMLTQIAREAGARVVGLAGGPAKLDFARPYGAEHLIDYLRDDWPREVLKVTDGRGVDLVVDGNGGREAARNLCVVAPLAQIFYIGATAGEMPSVPDAAELIAKNLRVGGFTLAAVESPPGSAVDREVAAAVVSGRWRIPISRVAALADVPQLHADLEARRLMGRVVIKVS